MYHCIITKNIHYHVRLRILSVLYWFTPTQTQRKPVINGGAIRSIQLGKLSDLHCREMPTTDSSSYTLFWGQVFLSLYKSLGLLVYLCLTPSKHTFCLLEITMANPFIQSIKFWCYFSFFLQAFFKLLGSFGVWSFFGRVVLVCKLKQHSYQSTWPYPPGPWEPPRLSAGTVLESPAGAHQEKGVHNQQDFPHLSPQGPH